MKKLLLTLALLLPLTISAHLIGQSHFDWSHTGKDTNGNPAYLTGYMMYCGTKSGLYTISYPITSPTATFVTLSEMNLPQNGMMYCAVKAVNAAGESAPSAEVSFPLVNGQVQPLAVPAAPDNFKLTRE